MPVYANRLLNFKKIKVVGFDMDYTLVAYNINAFEKLTHSLAVKRLVKNYDYPKIVNTLHFDAERAIVGLVIDKQNGNLLKISRFGRVKMAYHGLDAIDFRELSNLYSERVIDLRDPDFQSLDTAFAISVGVLFSQMVQLKKEANGMPDFRRIAEDINGCIDSIHSDGTIKTILQKNFSRYVIRDSRTVEMLELLKSYGKKLIIITNSDYKYSRALLDYALNPFLKKYRRWQELFDLVVTFADKPRFFEGKNRFFAVDTETGKMTNHQGPVTSGVWQGGWFGDIQEGLKIPGNEFLYLGDHIYGDIVSIKKLCDWRAGLVLNSLEGELEAIRNTQHIQTEIDELMHRKMLLECRSDQAELKRRFGKNVRLTEEELLEQDWLNTHISERLEELKTHFNPYWGEILRAGSEESRYAEQVEKYACIYMTKISDLYEYSPRTYFRPPRRKLAHEIQ